MTIIKVRSGGSWADATHRIRSGGAWLTIAGGAARAWSVVMLGDSMVAPDSGNITPAQIEQKFLAAGAEWAKVDGQDGHQIEIANPGASWTTTGRIDQLFTQGLRPTVWAFMLGMNQGGMTISQQGGEMDKVIAKVRSLGYPCKIAWADWQSTYMINNYYGWGSGDNTGTQFNQLVAGRMASLGSDGHVIRLWDPLAALLQPYDVNHNPTGPAAPWFAADPTHPNTEGANYKFDRIVCPDVRAFATA